LKNVPAGKYQLHAINSNFGCTALSEVYEVKTAAPLRVDLLSAVVEDARCGQNNGSIQLNVGNGPAFVFNWLKDSSASVGSALTISNLAAGTYYCIATDTNGCTQNFFKRNIIALPLPTLDESGAVIRDDTCLLNTGAIFGLTALSDQPGLRFEWVNENRQVIGNQLQLSGVRAGQYQLRLTDARGCILNSGRYTISPVNVSLPAPVYASTKIEIARNTDATLRIRQPIPGQFELIDAATGDILQQNNSGDFVVRNVTSDRLLQVRYSSGPCISAITQINIKVFDDTRLTIPNAFTPNNDGVNDLFKIRVEGYFLLKYVRIYNRWGQLIYEFRDINLGWNGRKNAADLPVGTYYWVLEGIDVKNMPINRSGSVTLLR
jgi:gliding motility-associated-like protein